MTSIMKWDMPCYRRGTPGNPAELAALGRVTLRVDFERRDYEITLRNGGSLQGSILRYYAGRAYQAYGMFGFSTRDTVYLFGNNELFYPGSLFVAQEREGDLVWLPGPTGSIGPVLKASSTPALPEGLTKGRRLAALAYLSGTMIATPWGERAIETLQPGDKISILRDGERHKGEIVWTGSAHYTADRAKAREDEAGYPVCIRRDALGAGKPKRDLRVTAGHCLHLDGCFVPVRMLINGVTIFYDRAISAYTAHHLRLSDHVVLEANGAESESWLDTGTCLVFQRENADPAYKPDRTRPLIWSHEACAPLHVERHFVQKLWERLSPVSIQIFLSWRRRTSEPDLHLRDASGARLYPYRRTGQTYLFCLRGAQRGWTLCSRQVRPCDEIGPFINDRRAFGVLVSGATLWTSARVIPLMLERFIARQEGWYKEEGQQEYWTDGAASLKLDDSYFDGDDAIILSLTVAATRRYPVHFTEGQIPPSGTTTRQREAALRGIVTGHSP